MDELTMFDPTPYGPGKASKTGTPPSPVADTVVAAGERWNGTSRSTPGVAHFIVGPKLDKHGRIVAATVSACGLVVVAHTYEPTEQRPGCAECARRIKGS